jgi:hypothetical protein
MAGRHQTRKARRFSVALVSAATATATALTVGVEPPPAPPKRVLAQNVDLAAAIRLLPNENATADVTGGLGSALYDGNQALADTLIKAVVNGINLAAAAQAAGLDPQKLLNGLLAELPANLLPGILAQISLKVPFLDAALSQLGLGDLQILTQVLNAIGIPQITDGTLTGLLAILGLDLSNPLNLSNLALPGVNVVTAGSPFALLKMAGLDLGWTPSLPNSVAAEVNGTPYLKVGVNGVLNLVLDKLKIAVQNNPLLDPLGVLTSGLQGVINGLTSGLPDVLDLRVTPTVGVGLGAFAAAMSYQKVLDELAAQPGGTSYTGTDAVLGSLTVLPLILLNNPARPDGGAAARFGFLGSLLGIDTVNPTTQVTSNGTGTAVLGTGVKLGAANVLPILVDATYEYQPLSDLASWPNAFTLVNNLAAALSPTYMLRGLDVNGLTDQLTPQVTQALTNAAGGNPLALNLYLTLHSATLPMLEPLYLASDFLNLVGLSPLAQIPMRLANALAPALTTLTNIGYANAVQNPDGTITRDFSTSGTETPFLSFANIDYGKAIGDSVSQLFAGLQKEFFSGNPTPNTPNVLANLVKALLDGSLFNGGLLNSLTAPIAASTTAAATAAQTAAASIPSANAALLSVSSVEPGTAARTAATPKTTAVADGTAATATSTSTPAPTDTAATTDTAKPDATIPDTTTPATSTPDASAPDSSTGPKHAKPDGDSTPATTSSTGPRHAKPDTDTDTDTATGATTAPKHAKPTTNEVRDTANDFSPKHDKTADEPGGKGSDAAGATTAPSGAGATSDTSPGTSSDKAA